MTNRILLTIDVEDWFQVENFKGCIPFSSWASHELRVEQNTRRLLDLLDDAGSQLKGDGQRTTYDGLNEKVHATFFVLGWIAKRVPDLVREIQARGHEIASHGYHHDLCAEISKSDLHRDLVDSKKLLEDLTGNPIYGYRAPSFSIDDDILKIIRDCGYVYDSSYNTFGAHGRYGHIDLSGKEKQGTAVRVADDFYELPISNAKIGNKVLPWGGGGYFRLMPFPLFRFGVYWILKKQGAFVFYIHPWEIDPDQPKVNEASWFYKFRHYTNLGGTHSKLSNLIEAFPSCAFLTCCEYLELGMKENQVAEQGTYHEVVLRRGII
jgi:polysaccharide deacetylase family protein (PEP-CTERM system associated)